MSEPDLTGMTPTDMIAATVGYLHRVGVSRKYQRRCTRILKSCPHNELEGHCQRWIDNAVPLAQNKIKLKRVPWWRRLWSAE